MKPLKIYTDGACSGNQNNKNTGGWGAVLEYGEHRKELFGGEADTTNNRMEIMALLRALEAIKKESQFIEVFSDSAYLVKCFREKWYENWMKNGWKTASKTPVENRGLWESVIAYQKKHEIRFYQVKGHINPNSKNFNLDALFKDFIEKNEGAFTPDDFLYIIEMNNLADALANKGIESARQGTPFTDNV